MRRAQVSWWARLLSVLLLLPLLVVLLAASWAPLLGRQVEM